MICVCNARKGVADIFCTWWSDVKWGFCYDDDLGQEVKVSIVCLKFGEKDWIDYKHAYLCFLDLLWFD